MRARSSLARGQQVGTVLAVAAGLAWLAWQWPRSPALALGGALVLWFGYSVVLAVEFLALRYAGREEGVPRPGWAALARAWLAETWLNAVVFAWRQPFRWNAIPDHLPAAGQPRRRGVVLIHGFVCNRGVWNPWLQELRQRGIPFAAVNLEPAFGTIDAYPPIIEEAVRRVTEATQLPPILVCHSMGGLAARAWLRSAGALQRVHHVITIASPHHGTWFGHFSHVTNGREMRLDSRWLDELQAATTEELCARFTCWYSNCDNMVFPVTTATLPGADNRLVLGRAHVELAFDPQVMQASLAIIQA
jgi:triacylglycerol lipase